MRFSGRNECVEDEEGEIEKDLLEKEVAMRVLTQFLVNMDKSVVLLYMERVS